MIHKPGSRKIHIGSNSAGYFTLAIPEEDMEHFNLILNTAELYIGAVRLPLRRLVLNMINRILSRSL